MKIQLSGDVQAGQQWRASIGQGWVFRVLPIQPARYSGWDLVVDRESPAGFPDALLLATPPFGSVNEREIGTTFGLRAQDALGWNPRSFRFITDPEAFWESRNLFHVLMGKSPMEPPNQAATQRLLDYQKDAAYGEFHIVDARLTPGTADPKPYAENWGRAFSRTAYTVQPAADGKGSPLGTIQWIKFSATLTLPAGWELPPNLHSTRGACQQ